MKSKLDVVGAHLHTALQMIAIEADPISTHLPVMAAEEMILSLADHKNIQLRWDYRIFVKDKHHRDWRDAQRKSYNYFKHADRDHSADYTGPAPEKLEWLNEVQTLMNADGYVKLGGTWNPHLSAYAAWMMVRYPTLFHEDALAPELARERDYLASLPSTLMKKSLRLTLHRTGLLPETPPQ
jgi:hypothetical protein